MSDIDDKWAEGDQPIAEGPYAIVLQESLEGLVAKAKVLVDMLDDAERNHGGLYAGKTMRAANELRLELARWK